MASTGMVWPLSSWNTYTGSSHAWATVGSAGEAQPSARWAPVIVRIVATTVGDVAQAPAGQVDDVGLGGALQVAPGGQIVVDGVPAVVGVGRGLEPLLLELVVAVAAPIIGRGPGPNRIQDPPWVRRLTPWSSPAS